MEFTRRGFLGTCGGVALAFLAGRSLLGSPSLGDSRSVAQATKVQGLEGQVWDGGLLARYGTKSGLVYEVEGSMPGVSALEYPVRPGDRVVWKDLAGDPVLSFKVV